MAARVQFDQTPAVDAVKAALAVVGVPVPVKACSPGGVVTGPLAFQGPVDLAQGLRRLGGDVVFTGAGFEVGCAMQHPPQVANVPSGNPLDPLLGSRSGVPQYSERSDPNAPLGAPFGNGSGGMAAQTMEVPQPIAEPPEVKMVQTHYVRGGRLIEMLKGLPGFQVLGDVDRVGPLLLIGPKGMMGEAVGIVQAVDQCPAKVEVQAAVLAKDAKDGSNRGLGLKLSTGNGNSFVGTDQTGVSAGFRINIPQLQAFITAERQRSGLIQLATLGGEVVQGEALTLNDGGEVPIRQQSVSSNGETRTGVTYKKTGHLLTIKVLAVGEFIVGEIEHEISTVGPATDLGPTFATRATKTTFRLRPYEPLALSLSGLQSASEGKTSGILFGRSNKDRSQSSGVLVLSLKPLSCALERDGVEPSSAPESPQGAREGATPPNVQG